MSHVLNRSTSRSRDHGTSWISTPSNASGPREIRRRRRAADPAHDGWTRRPRPGPRHESCRVDACRNHSHRRIVHPRVPRQVFVADDDVRRQPDQRRRLLHIFQRGCEPIRLARIRQVDGIVKVEHDARPARGQVSLHKRRSDREGFAVDEDEIVTSCARHRREPADRQASEAQRLLQVMPLLIQEPEERRGEERVDGDLEAVRFEIRNVVRDPKTRSGRLLGKW